MRHTIFLACLCLGGCLLFMGCPPDTDPPILDPSACSYDAPALAFSDPRECTPQLTQFENLHLPPSESEDTPPLPPACEPFDRSVTTRLPGAVVTDGFVLHLYNGTSATAILDVFGETDCGEFEPVTDCQGIDASVGKVSVRGLGRQYRAFYIRVIVSGTNFHADDFLALAAYKDGEPSPAGEITYANNDGANGFPVDNTDPTRRLEFSCDGTSFQRLLLSDCSDPDALRDWVARTNLQPEEEYYSSIGSVVALGIPPGLDLHTSIRSTARRRDPNATGNGQTAEPDYLINLFNPKNPSDIGSGGVRFFDDPNIRADYPLDEEYLEQVFGPVQPIRVQPGKGPLLLTIIDSGVASGGPTQPFWDAARYELGNKTQYVKPGTFGFDFIMKDHTPDDVVPHGSYVAASALAQYRSDRDLDLLHFKIFGEEGVASYFGALVSIYEATLIGSQAINMSWGFYLKEEPAALTCAVSTAVGHGVLMLASAGNDSSDLTKLSERMWPATFAKVYPDSLLAVSSYWYDGKPQGANPGDVRLMDYANYGNGIIPLAAYRTVPVPDVQTGQVTYPLGTSFSTPLVSGTLLNNMAITGSSDMWKLLSGIDHTATIQNEITGGQYLPLPQPSGRP